MVAALGIIAIAEFLFLFCQVSFFQDVYMVLYMPGYYVTQCQRVNRQVAGSACKKQFFVAQRLEQDFCAGAYCFKFLYQVVSIAVYFVGGCCPGIFIKAGQGSCI